MIPQEPPEDWPQIRHRLLKQVEEDAERVIDLFGLKGTPKTPNILVKKLFKDKVEIIYSPLHESISGLTTPSRGKWIITINSRHSHGTQRSTLFHETWHAYTGETGFSLDEPEWLRLFKEQRANVFAVYILMRPGWVRKYWRKFRLEDTPYKEIVDELVSIFDVSREAVISRLVFLNCVT